MLYVIVTLLVIANIINIGADIGAMGAALNLLIGGPAHLYCALFALVSVVLQVRIPYKTYSRLATGIMALAAAGMLLTSGK
jgi:Mn2+/Fe2+ NRAMP family transporter